MKNKSKKRLITILITIFIIMFSVYSFAEEGQEGEETPTTGESEETTQNTTTTTENTVTEETPKEETTPEDTTKKEEVKETKEEPNNQEIVEQEVVENTEPEEKTPEDPVITINTETTNQTSAKSSNANLGTLGITPNDFTGFRENITTYNVSVPNTVNQINVYATPKDSRAIVSGTGSEILKEGLNVVKLVVTAEDGTKKIYTINIKRLKDGETAESQNTNSGLGLKKLEISGLELVPVFKQDTYQYKVALSGSAQNIEIKAEASQEDATIRILGNENLFNGQNIVTILVTDADNNVTTYQIYVNKNLVESDEIASHMQEAEQQYKTKMLIIKLLIILIVICMIVLSVLIYKKSNKSKNKIKESENIKTENYNKTKSKSTGRHSK